MSGIIDGFDSIDAVIHLLIGIIDGFDSTDSCIPVRTPYPVALTYPFIDEFWHRLRRRSPGSHGCPS